MKKMIALTGIVGILAILFAPKPAFAAATLSVNNVGGAPQWTTLSTNTTTNGVVQFDDISNAALPTRFYRALVAP